MEERRHTPLPPGVVPSNSREDLYDQLQEDSVAQKPAEKLLMEDESSDEEQQSPSVRSRKSRRKQPKKKPIEEEVHPNQSVVDPSSAWGTARDRQVANEASPQRIRSYRLPTEDLEGESSGSEVESVVSPVFKDPPNLPNDAASTPIKSEQTPSKKKTSVLKGLLDSIQRPSTPPRPMSPFRKHNKVLPASSMSSSNPEECAPDENLSRRPHSPAVSFLPGSRKIHPRNTQGLDERPSSKISDKIDCEQRSDVEITPHNVYTQSFIMQSTSHSDYNGPAVVSNDSADLTTPSLPVVDTDMAEYVDSEPQYSEVYDSLHGTKNVLVVGVKGQKSKDSIQRTHPIDCSVVIANSTQNQQEEEHLYSPVLKLKKKSKRHQEETVPGHARSECVYQNPSTSAENLSALNHPVQSPDVAHISPVSTPFKAQGRAKPMATQTEFEYYATVDHEYEGSSSSSDGSGTEGEKRAESQTEKLKKLKQSLHGQERSATDRENVPNDPSSGTAKVLELLSIHYAAISGNKKELLSAIEEMLGADIDMRDCDGRTALMHAVHKEHFSCVRLLVKRGADINTRSFDGSTALHQAAYMNSREAVALVLGLGGDGLMQDNDGRLPLHWATNNSSTHCMELMIDKVANLSINVKDFAGMTPLMWSAYNNRPHSVHFLKTLRADESLKDLDGMTALHWSVHKDSTKALQKLIDDKSSRYKDSKGRTVMHVIAEHGCVKGVSLVRSFRPPSVNDVDKEGRTPLHWAAACQKPESIRALLEAGADLTIEDNNGCTAPDYAVAKGFSYCSVLMEQHTVLAEGHPSDTQLLSLVLSPDRTPQRPNQEERDSGYTAITEPKGLNTWHQAAEHLKLLCHGGWLNKFTGKGRGPLHKRYFWINIGNGKICWASSNKPSDSDIRADNFVDVSSCASPHIVSRRDYDPLLRHKYSFTIMTSSKLLDVVAYSSVEYKLWINGLSMLCQLGIEQASQILRSDS